MTEVKDVTGTAFVVAEFRARENDEARPLYRDLVVPIFLDERTKRAADAIAAGFPAADMNVRIRTRYFDDRLDQQLANGCRQVVILGSGLDTRGVRKRRPGVAYFEIDDPSTISFKQARLAERGFDAPIQFIAANYVASGVVPLLEANGFDCDLPSFFIWEGNTMYLTEPAVVKVLRDLRGRVSELAISFDSMDKAVVARTTGEAGATGFVERFAAMGAPWSYGIDDLDALVQASGMTVADAVTVGDLHREFWPERPLESIIYDHYTLCTLVPDAASRT
ncbi:MAG: class I SAM-dependent methyltransferase [Terriglobia bacterium]